MKMKLLSLVAAFGLCVPMVATEMCVDKNDGTVVKYDIDDVKKIYYEYYDVNGVHQVDGHVYVDLGLPSGLKWATMNVGAKEENDYGVYYAWGEVAPGDDNEYYGGLSVTFRKTTYELEASGVLDANGNLTAEYDAATANWGENWRMPTIAEWEELLDNCTWTWTSLGGENGYKVASKATGNNNWIFLPAAGYREGSYGKYEGSRGYYWSSTVPEKSYNYEVAAYYHTFDSNSGGYGKSNWRYYGQSVRPVVKE